MSAPLTNFQMMTSADLERRSRREGRARIAYEIFAYRTSRQIAFERLSNHERQAWIEIVQFLEADPECRCGQVLLCVDCDTEMVYTELTEYLEERKLFRLGTLLDYWLRRRKRNAG